MQATFAEMKKYNVVKAIASNHYEAVLRWKAASPDQIIVSYGFDDPSTVDLAFLRREHAAGRLLPGRSRDPVRRDRPERPENGTYLVTRRGAGYTGRLHIGLAPPGTPYKCCPKFRNTSGNPALLEEVLVRHPKLRIYLMHAGLPYHQETLAIMHMYPQVYADLGVLDWNRPREEFHEYLRALVRSGLGKRLMFGSDQMVWPEAIGMAIEGIQSASFLTEEQKRDIFYNNAVRFLRLDVQ